MTKLASRTGAMKPGSGHSSVPIPLAPRRRGRGHNIRSQAAVAALGFVLVNLATGCAVSTTGGTGGHLDPRLLAAGIVGLVIVVSLVKLIGRLLGEAFRVVFGVIRALATIGLAMTVVIGGAALVALAAVS